MDINTVLGKIDSSSLGETLFHEHVICLNPAFRQAFGSKYFDRDKVIERAIKMFKQAKEECGVSTIIDGTPIDLGRDIETIKTVSEQSGVNIIVSTGIYCNEEAFLFGKPAEKLAKYFIDECKNGIGASNVKPAILKCATGKYGITSINENLLTAMAITQTESGLPLYCHNEHGLKTPFKQFEIFANNGVDFKKIIIGHCSDSYDVEYLEDIAKAGCYISFDRIFPNAFEAQAEIIYQMIERGYIDKILLSHDYSAFLDFGNEDFERQLVSNRDFTTVHKKLLPYLKERGVKNDDVKKLTINNPKRILSGE